MGRIPDAGVLRRWGPCIVLLVVLLPCSESSVGDLRAFMPLSPSAPHPPKGWDPGLLGFWSSGSCTGTSAEGAREGLGIQSAGRTQLDSHRVLGSGRPALLKGTGAILVADAAFPATPSAEEEMLFGPIPVLFKVGRYCVESVRDSLFRKKDTGESQSVEDVVPADKPTGKFRKALEKEKRLTQELFVASRRGFWREAERLVKRGVDVNTRDFRSWYCWSPLFYATTKSHLYTTKKLLELGANPNLMDWDQWTPLHYVAYIPVRDQMEIARELVEHGADVFETTWDGKTARILAEKYGFPELASYLRDQERSKVGLFGRFLPIRRTARLNSDGIRADRERWISGLCEQEAVARAT